MSHTGGAVLFQCHRCHCCLVGSEGGTLYADIRACTSLRCLVVVLFVPRCPHISSKFAFVGISRRKLHCLQVLAFVIQPVVRSHHLAKRIFLHWKALHIEICCWPYRDQSCCKFTFSYSVLLQSITLMSSTNSKWSYLNPCVTPLGLITSSLNAYICPCLLAQAWIHMVRRNADR